MGLPWSGPVTQSAGCCDPAPGTYPPDIANYVVSLNNLSGILTLAGTGAIQFTTSGSTITASLSASAGLGSVTSVGLTSTSLTVTGSPITTNGSFTVNLTGATASIQNLVTAADKMIYTTASNVYATTDLTSFARTLLDDANAAASRSTLGLVIGTNVQAWSADLDSLVTNTIWTGANVEFTGQMTIDGATVIDSTLNVTGTITGVGITCASVTASGAISGATLAGAGSSITALNATNVASGTLAVARGGTGFAGGYTIGDLLTASGASTFTKLSAVSTGGFLRGTGVGSQPQWSTLVLPNAATTGDLLYGSSSNNIGRLTAVATGNALISGGVATAPSWGKITTSHTTGIAASGSNSDITNLTALASVSSAVVFTNDISVEAKLYDGSLSEGFTNDVLTSSGSNVLWSSQLNLSTLNLSSYLTLAGTVTAAGTTGARTINKPVGTVNFAAAATSLVVTNSLCTASSIITATVGTNDATMKTVAVVAGAGFFTLYANAGATAETRVNWHLINPT